MSDPAENTTNSQIDWWQRPVQGLHFAEYQVNEDTVVMIGARPDFSGTTPEFFKSVNGWINVSDRIVRYPPNVSTFWFPWNEAGEPSLEVIFSCLKTLNYWINELKLPRIYLSCDGGTHRAVTLFGFYLLAYHKENAASINATYKLTQREHWSDPLEYAESYLKRNPTLQAIIQEIKNTVDTNTHGHSLDDFLRYLIGEDKLAQYQWERYIKATIPLAIKNSLRDLKFFFKHRLVSIPFAKSINWVHKKLNTQKGKELKRFKL